MGWDRYPFACIVKDSDLDGKAEIHVGYSYPEINIFEYNGEKYELIFEKTWDGEWGVIEALDVGEVDNDGTPEVCVGTNLVHILQWNGETYVEEAVLPTYGNLAVLNIGDTDNDGLNEIHAASVGIDNGQDYMFWIFKHGIEGLTEPENYDTGALEVTVQSKFSPLNGGSVGALNLENSLWYDLQPAYNTEGLYRRPDLPDGQYYVRGVVDGYQVQDTTLDINKGETTSHIFTLQSKSKDITRQDFHSLLSLMFEKINYIILQFLKPLF
jgi:hypothetical protein